MPKGKAKRLTKKTRKIQGKAVKKKAKMRRAAPAPSETPAPEKHELPKRYGLSPYQ